MKNDICENVTIIVKTMNRYTCLKKLLKSIYKYYPTIRVLIADDGSDESHDKIMKEFASDRLKYIMLEPDTGLSHGRNVLLKQVTTPYFVLCDDDFIFDKKTDLNTAYHLLEGHHLDMIGGYCRNYKMIHKPLDHLIAFGQTICRYFLPTNYMGYMEEKKGILKIHYIIHEFPEYQESDLILNFFLAKTESILKIGGWDDELKLQEHTAFFYKAKKANLKIAFTNRLSVLHAPVRNRDYKKMRNRNFVPLFMKKYNIHRIEATYDNEKKTMITTLDENGNTKVEERYED